MKTKELFDKPEKWTKGHYSLMSNGEPCLPFMGDAVCWCLAGAVHFCYQDNYKLRDAVFKTIDNSLGYLTISEWNDAPERTFEEVKALVEKLDI